jgi:hypothetical protein
MIFHSKTTVRGESGKLPTFHLTERIYEKENKYSLLDQDNGQEREGVRRSL